MYLITFKPDDKDSFRVMWDAVKRPKKGKDEIRTQAKILRKMQAISTPIEDVLEITCMCGRKTALPPALQVANTRDLKPEGGYFDIDLAERKLIETRLDEFEPLDKFVLALDDAMGKVLDIKDLPDSATLHAAIAAFNDERAGSRAQPG